LVSSAGSVPIGPTEEGVARIRELQRLDRLLAGQVLPIDIGGGSWVAEHPAPGR